MKPSALLPWGRTTCPVCNSPSKVSELVMAEKLPNEKLHEAHFLLTTGPGDAAGGMQLWLATRKERLDGEAKPGRDTG